MENSLTVTRRVPSPKGGMLGVRVANGPKGWRAGVGADQYDAMEPELERSARERVRQETREDAMKRKSAAHG